MEEALCGEACCLVKRRRAREEGVLTRPGEEGMLLIPNDNENNDNEDDNEDDNDEENDEEEDNLEDDNKKKDDHREGDNGDSREEDMDKEEYPKYTTTNQRGTN